MDNAHAACDRQDITRARITQDIGVVAVIDTSGLLLAISSDHLRHRWVRKEVEMDDLECLKVDDVFFDEIVGAVHKGIAYCAHQKPPKNRTYSCDIFFATRTYVTMFAQADGRLVLEIENFDRPKVDTKSIVDTSNVIGKLTGNTLQVATVNDLCEELFRSSLYDRAMTYKFLDDLSGEVVYEIQNDQSAESSFLGMRFPPGDIPLPARKAYVKNPVRFIADVEKESCQLLQKNPDISLSRSFLRGCVMPHKFYLRNMGVRSSLSIAITNLDGELWGLIAMHSYTKPVIPKIEDRVSYAILAGVASNHVQSIERGERLAVETRMKNLVAQIDPMKSLGVFIAENKQSLLDTFKIDSVSVFTPDGEPIVVGENGAKLEDLPLDNEPLSCGTLEDPLRSFACLGVLGYKIVFTRMRSYQPISWAGNPDALGTQEISSGLVMPRMSFDKYLDHRSRHPPPFTKQDRVVFAKTGDLLKSVIHKIKIEYVERKVENAKKQSDLIEMQSDENYAFFANMSHELRTPLHAISGVFDILHELEEPSQEEHVRAVTRYSKIGLDTCKDMMKTLNDILTVVRKTHEGKRIEISLVMINEIFNSTSRGLRVFAAKNSVSLKTAFKCDPESLVRIDVQKTIQVFNNVVGNAIKFSSKKKNATVEVDIQLLNMANTTVFHMWTNVSAEYADGYNATHTTEDCAKTGAMCKWLVVQTRDEGCGIPKKNMPQIFEMFSQVGDVVTKKFASTGLGLHIALNNIVAMKGFMAVASTPNEGSLFFYAIPVEDVVTDTGGESGTDVARQTRVTADVSEPTGGFANERVVFVIVDDSKVNVMIAKKQIERAFLKANVYTASNGKLGLEEVFRLQEEGIEIDGIFMDYHMPVMSGLEATRQIRKKHRVPVTMLTADITEISRQAMLSCGSDFILLKPSRPNEIVAICVEMIQLKKS